MPRPADRRAPRRATLGPLLASLAREVREHRRRRRRNWVPGRPANRTARVVGLLGVLGLVIGYPVWGLLDVQVMDAAAYVGEGEETRQETEPITAMRGSILDAAGRPVALSIPRKRVVADKLFLVRDLRLTEEHQILALGARIEAALGCGPTDGCRENIGRTLADAKPTSRYVVLAETVDAARARSVTDGSFPGISLEDTYYRAYPQGPLGRTTIGRVQAREGFGQSGLEARFEETLQGVPGKQVSERNVVGDRILGSTRELQPARQGEDVVTTLDMGLQNEVDRLLIDGIRSAQATRGVVVVGRPGSGDLLAVSSAEYDEATNEYRVADSNLAFQYLFQPGSFVKSITVAAAYDQGVIGEDSLIDTPSRLVMNAQSEKWRKEYTNAETGLAPRMLPADVLAHSVNTGTIQIAQRVGKERLAGFLDRFGMGARTSVGFPHEVAGSVPEQPWTDTDLASASIGTSVSSTAVQMWAAFAALANGGTYVAPRLASATGLPGSHRDLPEPEPRRVVSEAAATAVGHGLVKVMTEGTGRSLAIPGYSIAAKSGTSPKPLTKGQSPDQQRYTTTFSGYLPVHHPEYVVTVIVDEPMNIRTQSGSSASGPVFRAVAQQVIERFHVAPDPSTSATPGAPSAAIAGAAAEGGTPGLIRAQPAVAPTGPTGTTGSSGAPAPPRPSTSGAGASRSIPMGGSSTASTTSTSTAGSSTTGASTPPSTTRPRATTATTTPRSTATTIPRSTATTVPRSTTARAASASRTPSTTAVTR